jgi:hypothetical protein
MFKYKSSEKRERKEADGRERKKVNVTKCATGNGRHSSGERV